MGVDGQRYASTALSPRMTRYPLQEAGWALGSVWTGAENLAPTGIRSPYRPARSDLKVLKDRKLYGSHSAFDRHFSAFHKYRENGRGI
jgi:hypothetical protein